METSWLEIAAFLLPCFLALLGAGSAARYLGQRRLEIMPALRRHWRAVALAALVLTFLIVDLPFLIDKVFDITSPVWRFWLATASGNWSPDSFPALVTGTGGAAAASSTPPRVLSDSDRFMFAMSASLAFWINNLIVLTLVGWVWHLAVERRKAMDFAAALRLKESFARSAAQDLVEKRFDEPYRQRVLDLFDAAMKQGQIDLEKVLPKIDAEHGKEILAAMRQGARAGSRRSASAA